MEQYIPFFQHKLVSCYYIKKGAVMKQNGINDWFPCLYSSDDPCWLLPLPKQILQRGKREDKGGFGTGLED